MDNLEKYEAIDRIKCMIADGYIDISRQLDKNEMDIITIAIEKQIPKKLVINKNWCFSLLCPCCGNEIADTEHRWSEGKENIKKYLLCCPKCGQLLSYDDVE